MDTIAKSEKMLVTFRRQIPWLLITLAFLSLPLWLTPNSISFAEFVVQDIVRLLTSILFIALLLERFLEVFISTWREPDANRLEQDADSLEKKISVLGDKNGEDAQEDLEELLSQLEKTKKESTEYKSGTKQRALRAAFVLGILISAVGVRALQEIMDPESLKNLSTNQAFAFLLIDVLMTGGLIAGGSEGIHRIVNVFTNFADATAESIANKEQ